LHAQVSIDSCIPPKSQDKHGLQLPIKAARQAPVSETPAGEAERIPSIYAPPEFAGAVPITSECFGIKQVLFFLPPVSALVIRQLGSNATNAQAN